MLFPILYHNISFLGRKNHNISRTHISLYLFCIAFVTYHQPSIYIRGSCSNLSDAPQIDMIKIRSTGSTARLIKFLFLICQRQALTLRQKQIITRKYSHIEEEKCNSLVFGLLEHLRLFKFMYSLEREQFILPFTYLLFIFLFQLARKNIFLLIFLFQLARKNIWY